MYHIDIEGGCQWKKKTTVFLLSFTFSWRKLFDNNNKINIKMITKEMKGNKSYSI